MHNFLILRSLREKGFGACAQDRGARIELVRVFGWTGKRLVVGDCGASGGASAMNGGNG